MSRRRITGSRGGRNGRRSKAKGYYIFKRGFMDENNRDEKIGRAVAGVAWILFAVRFC